MSMPTSTNSDERPAATDIERELFALMHKLAQHARSDSDATESILDHWHEVELLIEEQGFAPNQSAAIKEVYRQFIDRTPVETEPELSKVLCLGPTGSFTHLAALKFFGKTAQYKMAEDIHEIFYRLARKEVDYALLAVSNSISGPLGENFDQLFPNLVEQNPIGAEETPILVCGEQVLRIEHCLISNAKDINQLSVIHTHKQGLAQCRKSIEELQNELGRRLTLVDEQSTSSGARKAALDQTGTIGAIAHRLTADLLQLNVLKEHFEDNTDNFTRFLILGRTRRQRTGRDVTSIWLRLKDEPGALVNALDLLRQSNLNMTSLISRPIQGEPWSHSFVVEFDGHADDPRVREVLQKMKKRFVPGPKLLGSYPRCPDFVEVTIENEFGVDQTVTKTPSKTHPVSKRIPPIPTGVANPLIVGIIGVRGAYGKFLTELFKNKFHYQVIGSDIADPDGLTNQEVVEKSDVVVFSVSLSHADNVIRELADFSRPEQLWMDVTSVKTKPIAAMMKSNAEIIGLHPMCAPSVGDWRGQPINVCPVRCYAWLDWLNAVLRESEAKPQFTGPETHDRLMAVLQVLPHTLYLTAASVLKRMDVDIEEVLASTTPTFSMIWYGLNRFLSNDPTLCADLQLKNADHALNILDHLLNEIGEIRELVAADDRMSFVERIESNQEFIGNDNRARAAQRFADFIRINTDLDNENSIEIFKANSVADQSVSEQPGLLKEAIDVFAEFGLDMTSLHSFPSLEGGHRFKIGAATRRNSSQVQQAIGELQRRGWTVD